ncbi:MAG TPA: hydroxysqualene dehydroxylase HpnE [Pseudolabrys sp.]|jgi:squalene-associated FAD-dependent desaturase|nr:hydroxysqualene dehydroxylase HpnE [Pseudolabrys sp.]
MHSSEVGTVHIIGAGLAGLAAAVRLVERGRSVVIHEATMQPGGRCRSYFDQTAGMVIDNGTHLVLSGNHAALAYARTIGGIGGLDGPETAEFPFVDMSTGARWTVQFNDSAIPWWIFDKKRRVPQTSVKDYLPLARLVWNSDDKPLSKVMNCNGPLYERLIAPFFLAALNVEPASGSARLAGALVRETLAKGGAACRPLLAREGVGTVFVDPAITFLQARGAEILLQHELHALRFSNRRVTELEFANDVIAMGANDYVILAVPAYAAANLVPGLKTPSVFRGILNVHFRADPPPGFPPMTGIINGTSEWLFAFPGRISVTISDAAHMFSMPRDEVARTIWDEAAKVMGVSTPLPPWQIVRERRATFAATPEENAKRPAAQTRWPNLILAGDWTATGLPATLESAIRSGNRAADLAGEGTRIAA